MKGWQWCRGDPLKNLVWEIIDYVSTIELSDDKGMEKLKNEEILSVEEQLNRLPVSDALDLACG